MRPVAPGRLAVAALPFMGGSVFFKKLFRGRSATKAIEGPEDSPVEELEVGPEDIVEATADTAESLVAVSPVPSRGLELGGPSVGGFRWEDAPALGPLPDGRGAEPQVRQSSPAEAAPEPRRGEDMRARRRLARRRMRPLHVPGLMEQALIYQIAAQARTRAGDAPEEAANLWTAYLELTPGDGEGWLSLGHCWWAAGDLEAAEAALEQSIERLAEDPRPWVQLGQLAELRGDVVLALSHFQRAVTEAPHRADVLDALAAAQGRAGFEVEAAETRRRIGELER